MTFRANHMARDVDEVRDARGVGTAAIPILGISATSIAALMSSALITIRMRLPARSR
jgi:hypothetical protein